MLKLKRESIGISTNRNDFQPKKLFSRFSVHSYHQLDIRPAEQIFNYLKRLSDYNAHCILSDQLGLDIALAITTLACSSRAIIKQPISVECGNYLKKMLGQRHRLIGSLSIAYRQEGKIITRNKIIVTNIKLRRLDQHEQNFVLQHLESSVPVFYLNVLFKDLLVEWAQGSYSNISGSYTNEIYSMLKGNNLASF